MRAFPMLPAIAFAALLTGCGYFSDELPYPPLDPGRLVGCWVAVHPTGFWCDEQCYSSSGSYYSRANSGHPGDKDPGLVEAAGTYSVAGRRNAVTLTVRIGNNIEPPDTAFRVLESNYTIMRDTLFSITNNGLNLNPFVRAGSTDTCGPKWQVFPRPDGWDLD